MRVNDWADRIIRGLTEAKLALAAAKDRQKLYADVRRRPLTLTPGQKVLLSSKNLKIKSPGSVKLLPKWVGPFEITHKINEVAFRLALPPGFKVHDVFHVSLLKPFESSARSQPPPPPVELDGELYFTIDRILEERVVGKVRPRREYLIKWQDYGAEHNSWEPERTILTDSNDSVREFWAYAKHPIPAPLHNIGVATARNASRVAMQMDRHKPLRMSTTTRKPRSSGLDHAQMACVALGIPGLASVPTLAPGAT
jgi:hypothetical protein